MQAGDFNFYINVLGYHAGDYTYMGQIAFDVVDGGASGATTMSAFGSTVSSLTLDATAGTIAVTALKTTGAASGKKTVCVDTTTGQLYASSTGTDCSN